MIKFNPLFAGVAGWHCLTFSSVYIKSVVRPCPDQKAKIYTTGLCGKHHETWVALRRVKLTRRIPQIPLNVPKYWALLNAAMFLVCDRPDHSQGWGPVPNIHRSYRDWTLRRGVRDRFGIEPSNTSSSRKRKTWLAANLLKPLENIHLAYKSTTHYLLYSLQIIGIAHTLKIKQK